MFYSILQPYDSELCTKQMSVSCLCAVWYANDIIVEVHPRAYRLAAPLCGIHDVMMRRRKGLACLSLTVAQSEDFCVRRQSLCIFSSFYVVLIITHIVQTGKSKKKKIPDYFHSHEKKRLSKCVYKFITFVPTYKSQIRLKWWFKLE